MAEWTDELRAWAVAKYKDANPTPDNSFDIVKTIADEMEDTTPNGVRSILSKAGVYVKKTPGSGASASSDDKPKSTRVNKADAQEALTNLIESLGKDADQDIINKLTGKAALYLVEVFKQD